MTRFPCADGGKSVEKRKKKWGDRKDAYRVRETDPMHTFMPYLMPNRADNEAVLNEKVDLTAVMKYLEEKNKDNPEFKYTLFHVFCAAISKVMTLRPKMNYFYSGYRLYEKKDLVLAFTVKKKFTDDSPETLAIVKVDRDSEEAPIEQIRETIRKIVYSVRKENKNDGATDIMGVLQKLPRWLIKIFVRLLNFLEYHGWLPKLFFEVDPFHSSVFLTNLGSIKMNANYHHLANWGTNSFFVVIGEKHKYPVYDENGNMEMHDCLDLGLTIDERIADGVYFAKSIRLLRAILKNPDVLDMPISTEVEYE